MTARQIFTLILLCAGVLGRVWAQPGDVPRISDVSHYRSYDGLASERVYSIQQTADGAVWFGTRVGVDRFNGRTFMHYSIKDPKSQQDYAGRVIRLFHRRGQVLCAYDNKGRIYAYDSRRDAFELDIRLGDHLQGDIVLNAVSPSDDGSLLIGLVRGLYRYSNGRLSQLNGQISVNDIDTDGSTVYAAATDGLYVVSGKRTSRLLPGVNVQTVHCDGPGGLVYLGSYDRGLWQYDSHTRRTSRVAESTRELERPIRAIERLDAHHMAVGVDGGGVYLYDQRNGNARLLIDTDDSHPYCLNGNGVYALLRDSYGTLWAGSYTGGASAMQFRRGAVTTLLHRQGNPNTLCNNNINGIAQSVGGDIWFATDRGMSILSPGSGAWRHPEPKNVIVCLEPTADGGMLAGTYGAGIYRLNGQGAVVETLTKQSGQLTSNSIFSILRSTAGEYWAASLDGGVMRLDARLRPVTTYPVSVAFSLTETPDRRIAVGTANGYYIIDPADGRLTQYASSGEFGGSGSSYIISMLYDSPGRVWLGTEGGGIYLYDQARRKVLRNYTTADGLPANNIYSMQRDRRGLLVVSTGNGLAMMQQGRFKSLNYYRGLGKEYNKSAGTLLRNGDMVFGSVYGAEMVVPSQLAEADFEARVRITGITGMRQVADSAAAADNSVADVIAQGQRLPIDGNRARLDYANNSFTIHFEAINLPYQDDIAYQYLLQGYEDTWSPVSAYNQAEYKNVSPGNYTFRVRSVRRSDGMVLDEVAMPLTVGTPWWLSWWAWTLYVLIGVGVVVFVYRYNWFKLRELHDRDKIRFFINTAHDIRTPVSLVMAPVNDLKADATLSPAARKLVETAASNIAKLYSVTSQLLEFERFDSGGERLDLKPVNLNGLLTLEAECFRDACSRKRIHLHMQLPQEHVAMTGDHYLLEMLLDNLLSNACKYTDEGGQISLSLTADRRRVQITVSDNGIGIPTRERRKVLREVYRAGNARQTNAPGTGFGLLQARRITELLGGKLRLQSTEGVGTTVTISFARLNAQAESVTAKQTRTFVDSGVQLNAAAVATANLELAASTDRAQHHSLLIVEDNDELRGYLHDMFAATYSVHAVANAEQAFEYMHGHYPDLILSDVMMPGMQGDELCRRIKSDPATAGIPVVLLTAKADHDSVVDGLQCGADDYLPKPFNSDILRLKIQGIIANRDRLRHQLLNTAISRATQQSVATASRRGALGDSSDLSLDTQMHHGETPWPPEAEADGGVSASDRAFVSKATDLVLANLADPEFGIEQLCRQIAMSRTLFYSRLKALTGQAPQDFIRMLRLERAAKLLGQQVPVAEAAESCGFANVKYFSTVFKKHFGLQPSRYAARHQPAEPQNDKSDKTAREV